jgi:hypothetical protein
MQQDNDENNGVHDYSNDHITTSNHDSDNKSSTKHINSNDCNGKRATISTTNDINDNSTRQQQRQHL